MKSIYFLFPRFPRFTVCSCCLACRLKVVDADSRSFPTLFTCRIFQLDTVAFSANGAESRVANQGRPVFSWLANFFTCILKLEFFWLILFLKAVFLGDYWFDLSHSVLNKDLAVWRICEAARMSYSKLTRTSFFWFELQNIIHVSSKMFFSKTTCWIVVIKFPFEWGQYRESAKHQACDVSYLWRRISWL